MAEHKDEPVRNAKTDTAVYKTEGLGRVSPCPAPAVMCYRMKLFDRDRDDLARARQRVVQIVAELHRELVFAWCELRVEDILPVAEVHP